MLKDGSQPPEMVCFWKLLHVIFLNWGTNIAFQTFISTNSLTDLIVQYQVLQYDVENAQNWRFKHIYIHILVLISKVEVSIFNRPALSSPDHSSGGSGMDGKSHHWHLQHLSISLIWSELGESTFNITDATIRKGGNQKVVSAPVPVWTANRGRIEQIHGVNRYQAPCWSSSLRTNRSMCKVQLSTSDLHLHLEGFRLLVYASL